MATYDLKRRIARLHVEGHTVDSIAREVGMGGDLTAVLLRSREVQWIVSEIRRELTADPSARRDPSPDRPSTPYGSGFPPPVPHPDARGIPLDEVLRGHERPGRSHRGPRGTGSENTLPGGPEREVGRPGPGPGQYDRSAPLPPARLVEGTPVPLDYEAIEAQVRRRRAAGGGSRPERGPGQPPPPKDRGK